MISTMIPPIEAKATITGNDTPATAYEITSLPFTADIDIPSNANAWFKISLSKDRTLKFYNERYSAVYKIYSEEEVNKDEPTHLVESEYLSYGNLQYKLSPGVYYIELNAHGTYNASISEIIEDEYENNDVLEKATTVELGKEYDVNNSATNDIDLV